MAERRPRGARRARNSARLPRFLLERLPMDKLTFQLKIPERWMLWRVYNVEGDEDGDGDKRNVKDGGWDLRVKREISSWDEPMFCRHHDPVDEKGFDEAVSFPSVKPDRDLFGPPLRRSRKQRGWYHVKPWPPALVNTALQHYATGADIPEELFDNIVRHCEEIGYSRDDVKSLRPVCRRWEALSLPKMFGSITLKNHLEASTLSRLLDERMAYSRTLAAYPVPTTIRLEMRLDYEEGWRPWVDLPTLLSKLEANPCHQRIEWTIWGPLPAGRRLTSVYLSSPCRPHWRPLEIHELHLYSIHFRKLGDLIRLLRELPSLTEVDGEDITWDGEEYPRMTSFIPCSHPHSSITYQFYAQPELDMILVCALALSGSRPVAQSNADILYGLVSVFKPAHLLVSCITRFESGLYIAYSCPWPSVHVAFRPTQGKTQSVQSIAFDFSKVDDVRAHIDNDPWDSILGFIKKLVRDTRPEIMFLFPSTESTALFLEEASARSVAASIASGRVKCVIESIEEQTLKLVKSDENGGWRELELYARYRVLKL